MLEIPESMTIAKQLNRTVRGKAIRGVIANASPHKYAFFCGDPVLYGTLLSGKTIGDSVGIGSMVEISADDCRIVLGDGVNLRYCDDTHEMSPKHQLLIELDDGSALVCTIQMYGMLYAFENGLFENKYYLAAKQKPQPSSDAFDRTYFDTLRTEGYEKLSAKAYLATGQRIPGLGNGTLQDILFVAGLHPKQKMGTLSEEDYDRLFDSVKQTLNAMAELGGRDTERDLFGIAGGYKTILSKNTVNTPCPVCGATIRKEAYLGGAVYWCPVCQPPG